MASEHGAALKKMWRVLTGRAPDDVAPAEAQTTAKPPDPREQREADALLAGIVEAVCRWKGFCADDARAKIPTRPIFIRTDSCPWAGDCGRTWPVQNPVSLVSIWNETFGTKAASAKFVVQRIKEHIAAGRLKGLRDHRFSACRGWLLDAGPVVRRLTGGRRLGELGTRHRECPPCPAERCGPRDPARKASLAHA